MKVSLREVKETASYTSLNATLEEGALDWTEFESGVSV